MTPWSQKDEDVANLNWFFNTKRLANLKEFKELAYKN